MVIALIDDSTHKMQVVGFDSFLATDNILFIFFFTSIISVPSGISINFDTYTTLSSSLTNFICLSNTPQTNTQPLPLHHPAALPQQPHKHNFSD